jgi:hypothetical protein
LSFNLTLVLVAAGYALGLLGASQMAGNRGLNIIARPSADRTATLTTWLLRRNENLTSVLTRFIERATVVAALTTYPSSPSSDSCITEKVKP